MKKLWELYHLIGKNDPIEFNVKNITPARIIENK